MEVASDETRLEIIALSAIRLSIYERVAYELVVVALVADRFSAKALVDVDCVVVAR